MLRKSACFLALLTLSDCVGRVEGRAPGDAAHEQDSDGTQGQDNDAQGSDGQGTDNDSQDSDNDGQGTDNDSQDSDNDGQDTDDDGQGSDNDGPDIDEPLVMAVSPATVTVPGRAMQPFYCAGIRTSDSCTWQITEPNGGTISSNGMYTAPADNGTFHVVATSVADPTQSVTAVVTVIAPIVADCDSLPEPGVWENITPPEVWDDISVLSDAGAFAFVVDPINSGTVYLGTIGQKAWKSTDCGTTWQRTGNGPGTTTPNQGAVIDQGMNWTFVVDPTDPDVVYTNAGYGNCYNGFCSNGLFKSTNGGVDWAEVWPPHPDPDNLASHFFTNFVNTVSMEPGNNEHLLLSFHEQCTGRSAKQCIAESWDAGATWTLIDGDPRWNSTGEGVQVHFLTNSEAWLWGSQGDGVWRTEDAGATRQWKRVTTQGFNHLQATQLYRTNNGTFLLAVGELFMSPDGKTWSAVPNTNPLPGGVTSDGTTLYLSKCYYPSFCNLNDTATFYYTAPESDPTSWTPMPMPSATLAEAKNGGVVGYDRSHHILYSSNLRGGFWRIVTE